MKTIDEKVAVYRAWLEGKTIQLKSVEHGWLDIKQVSWDWDLFDYRVKPELTGSEKVRELLEQGKPVLCGTSDLSQEHADKRAEDPADWVVVVDYKNSKFATRTRWEYASPVDLSKLAQLDGE